MMTPAVQHPKSRGTSLLYLLASVPALALGVLSLLVIAGLSWLRRDPLGPVDHVERIVGLAANLGMGWAGAAVVALLLLPVPFLLAGRGIAGRAGLAVGVYAAITMVAAFVRSFPVPVMGYGVSPIIGYLVGVGAFLRTASPRQVRNPPPALPGS
jgi:hypothetical protein